MCEELKARCVVCGKILAGNDATVIPIWEFWHGGEIRAPSCGAACAEVWRQRLLTILEPRVKALQEHPMQSVSLQEYFNGPLLPVKIPEQEQERGAE